MAPQNALSIVLGPVSDSSRRDTVREPTTAAQKAFHSISRRPGTYSLNGMPPSQRPCSRGQAREMRLKHQTLTIR